MKSIHPSDSEDETNITEITLQADGRVYVFGLSRDVLEILQSLNPASPQLQKLLGHLQANEMEKVQQ